MADTLQAAFWKWVSETPLCPSCGRRLVRRTVIGTDKVKYEVLQCPNTAGRGFKCGQKK